MTAAKHPTEEQLASYLAGALPEEDRDRLTEHLDGCDSCQTTIVAMAQRTETVLNDLAGSAPENPYLKEHQYQQVIDRIAQIGCDPSNRSVRTEQQDEPVDLGSIRDYRLIAKLGEGGMGAVYKALHTQLDKVVALKVLSSGRIKDQQAVARFRREMKAVGRLVHPNIVMAHDAGEHEGTHFLVMEYVDGVDLSALVRLAQPLSPRDACELVRQAAIGLQYAHEHGLVHRDIKPSNLMLARVQAGSAAHHPQSAVVKILDLGLALLQSEQVGSGELTSTGQLMGTIDYMAPEQGDDSHAVDIRADIYSLGATLYKLLCGDAPLAASGWDTPLKKLKALAMKEPPPITERRDGLPEGLDAIVHRMLAKEPQQRYATPHEVAEALAPYAAGANLAGLAARVAQADSRGEREVSQLATTEQLSPGSVETSPSPGLSTEDEDSDFGFVPEYRAPLGTPRLRLPRHLLGHP